MIITYLKGKHVEGAGILYHTRTRGLCVSQMRFSSTLYFCFPRSVMGSMDTPNLLTCYSRTNLFRFSFMNRIAGEWNRFLRDIRRASSEANFKLKVFFRF